MTSCRRWLVMRSAPSLQSTIFFLHVNDAQPDQQTFQNAPTDLGIFEWRHGSPHH